MNGGWQDLKLQISASELSVTLETTTVRLSASGLPSQFGRRIYFGQSPRIFTAILAGTSLSYEGCIRQVTINGVPSQLRDAKRVSFGTPLPSAGCIADKCSESFAKQCSGNGYCVGNNTGLYCHCKYGYSGPSCEYCKL